MECDEDIVKEWTCFNRIIYYFSYSKDHIFKIRQSRLMIIAFCMLFNVVNIYVKSREDSLNGVLSYRADTLISQNQLFSDSKGQISQNRQSSVTLLAFYTS